MKLWKWIEGLKYFPQLSRFNIGSLNIELLEIYFRFLLDSSDLPHMILLTYKWKLRLVHARYFAWRSSQDCFKVAWSSHKSVHAKLATAASDVSSEQSDEGWQYCLRKGQMRTSKLPYFDWTGYFSFCHICNSICWC